MNDQIKKRKEEESEEETEEEEETTDDESESDEEELDSESEKEKIKETRKKNIPIFKFGLLKKDIKNIEKAMKEYEILKEEKNKPKLQKEITKKINEG